jgi:hypothetical protein
MKGRSVLDNMREICLALPDTKETLTWDDWNEVRPLVLESYRLIAPKRTLAKLGPPASRRRS